MMAGWHTSKLASLCDLFADGDWIESKDQSQKGIRLVQTGNVGIGEFKDRAEKARYISEDTFKRLRCTQIGEGDCLISRLPDPVGRACIIPEVVEKLITAVDCTIIRFNPEKINSHYFNYYAQSHEYLQAVAVQSTGATRLRISRANLAQIPVPTPSLREQQRIVSILDQAFEGIATATANAEKNLANARELFESYLQSVFTNKGSEWVDTNIGQHIRFIDYRGKTPVKTASGLRLITAKNVKMGYIQEAPMEFIATENYDTWMTRGIPRMGDVLFTTEAPLANVAQLDTDKKVAFAQRIIIMQPDSSKLDSTFLKYLLLSQPVQQRIHDKGTGMTAKGIKASLLRTIEISFPQAVAEQRQIVTKLDMLSAESKKIEVIYQQKLHALDELKKSILHQAFSGQLN